ncbi:hypothetical protein B0I37DRAFT_420180, partial [Chaetomium sp. MPI-CAGE-AT-0009]
MARKSNKGRKAQNADPGSVLQSRDNQKPQTQAKGTKQQQKKNRPRKGGRKNKNKTASQRPKKSNAQLRSSKMNNPQAQDPEPGARMPWDLDPEYSSSVDTSEISSVNDSSILVQLLQVSELGGMIIDLISPSIGDLTALAMSCKRVAACTRAKFDVWDFRLGVFPIDPYAEKDEEGRIVRSGGFRSNTLIISPTSNEPKLPKKPYMTDFKNMMQLCRAITQIPSTFRSIVLDQLPFFDVAMFEMMVNTMPRLTTVTITRCLLLDVTKLRPLLGVIKRHPRRLEDRPSRTIDDPWAKKPRQKTPVSEAQAQTQAQVGTSGKNAERETTQEPQQEEPEQGTRNYIRLDFSPFFFHGPESDSRLGSYGVTYNEPTFNTPKAVFALILQCRDLAQTVGMDLLSDSSSFWAFVRRLPGPDALWAIKARETLMTHEHEMAVGRKSAKVIWDRFTDDLTAALTGDNQAHPKIPGTMGRYLPHEMTKNYWRTLEKCCRCDSIYPASLFPIRRDVCWGCKMVAYVYMMEDSHLRLWQETAVRHWRSELNPRKTNLRKLLSYRAPTLDKAMEDVWCADWVREYFLKFNPPPQNTAAYDWGTDIPPEPLFCPPPPSSLDPVRASIARWRWDRAPATASFDYRKGGPQRGHPCVIPISPGDYSDPDYGAEAKEHFESRWKWTESSDKAFTEIWFEEYQRKVTDGTLGNLPPNIDDRHPVFRQELKRARETPKYHKKVRDSERLKQNKDDKTAYIAQLHLVEDCLFSMSTLTHKPFNLDKPIPDPGVNPVEYNRLWDEHRRMSNYGFRNAGSWQ